MSNHASAKEAAAAAAEAWKKAHPVGGSAAVGGAAREGGSGNVGASGSAAVAVAVAAAVAAGIDDAMAAAAVDADNAAAVTEADAYAKAENGAAFAATAPGEDGAFAGGEVEEGGEIEALGEGAGAIQGGIEGQQGGGAGEGVGIPIPALDQIHENSLRITTIIEQLAVALPMLQGLTEQVNALQHIRPEVGEGANVAGAGGSQEDGVGVVSNPNEAIA